MDIMKNNLLQFSVVLNNCENLITDSLTNDSHHLEFHFLINTWFMEMFIVVYEANLIIISLKWLREFM